MNSRQQSNDTADFTRNQVIEHLRDAPLNFSELYDCIPTLTDKKQLSNALFQLKSKGTIVQMEDKRYILAESLHPGQIVKAVGSGPATVSTRAPQRVKKTQSIRKPAAAPAKPATADSNGVGQIFEKLLRDAQSALDDYVYSVGDKQILDQLMAARDAARAAFQAHLKNNS